MDSLPNLSSLQEITGSLTDTEKVTLVGIMKGANKISLQGDVTYVFSFFPHIKEWPANESAHQFTVNISGVIKQNMAGTRRSEDVYVPFDAMSATVTHNPNESPIHIQKRFTLRVQQKFPGIVATHAPLDRVAISFI